SWTSARVASLRNHQKIAPYREGERAERGEITIEEAAAELAVSPSTIFRMINDGVCRPSISAKVRHGSSVQTTSSARACAPMQKLGVHAARRLGIHAKETLISKGIVSMRRIKPPSYNFPRALSSWY